MEDNVEVLKTILMDKKVSTEVEKKIFTKIF
uniref:Uncharacterized protein n=1 Tax=Rhizophora mucronata TaxID=61149 RepID=A0A2P2R3Z4_RHIMU